MIARGSGHQSSTSDEVQISEGVRDFLSGHEGSRSSRGGGLKFRA